MDNNYHPNFNTVPLQKPANKRGWVFILVAVLLGASVVGFYLFQWNLGSGREIVIDNGAQQQNQELDALIKEIGQLTVLPTDEKPLMAVVSNLEKLKNQPFFAQAKEGYKILIYTKAKKAILYDPTDKKIVNVSSIDVIRPGLAPPK